MNTHLRAIAQKTLAALAWGLVLSAQPIAAQESSHEPHMLQEEDGFVWYKMRANGACQVLDANRKVIIPGTRGYTSCSYVNRGGYFKTVKWITVNGTSVGSYGICLKDGTEILPVSRGYTQCYRNKANSRYSVKKGEYVGVCDSTGAEIISPDRGYTQCTRNRQFYQVSNGNYTGMCDYQTGAELISPKRKYTSCRYNPAWKCFCVKKGERSGACSLDGKEIVSPVWYSCIFNTTTKKWKGKRTINSPWEDIH